MLIDRFKLLFPKLLALLFIFLSYTPSHIYGISNFFPALDLMVVYYWSLYRPHVIPNWFVFSSGLIKDTLSGAPIGVNALSYIILRGLAIYKGGPLKSTFIALWHGFAIFTAIILLFKWLIYSFVFAEFVEVNMIIMQFIISILLYPFFHGFFNTINVILPSRSNA
jgi:rod shape-determining protein MreD